MNATTPDFYAYFLGRWTLTRSMLGADQAPVGQAEGVAEFVPGADELLLHYQESGKLHLHADQRVISFSRRFDYRIEGGEMQIAFADGPQAGQPYQSYRYDPAQRALLPVETHLCIADHYNGSYRLLDAGRFDLQTRIEGPRKDYLLHTQFTRTE